MNPILQGWFGMKKVSKWKEKVKSSLFIKYKKSCIMMLKLTVQELQKALHSY